MKKLFIIATLFGMINFSAQAEQFKLFQVSLHGQKIDVHEGNLAEMRVEKEKFLASLSELFPKSETSKLMRHELKARVEKLYKDKWSEFKKFSQEMKKKFPSPVSEEEYQAELFQNIKYKNYENIIGNDEKNVSLKPQLDAAYRVAEVIGAITVLRDAL